MTALMDSQLLSLPPHLHQPHQRCERIAVTTIYDTNRNMKPKAGQRQHLLLGTPLSENCLAPFSLLSHMAAVT